MGIAPKVQVPEELKDWWFKARVFLNELGFVDEIVEVNSESTFIVRYTRNGSVDYHKIYCTPYNICLESKFQRTDRIDSLVIIINPKDRSEIQMDEPGWYSKSRVSTQTAFGLYCTNVRSMVNPIQPQLETTLKFKVPEELKDVVESTDSLAKELGYCNIRVMGDTPHDCVTNYTKTSSNSSITISCTDHSVDIESAFPHSETRIDRVTATFGVGGEVIAYLKDPEGIHWGLVLHKGMALGFFNKHTRSLASDTEKENKL